MSARRLLCCMSSMNAGGAETFLMKQYRCIDREKYQLDFCVNVFERGYYDDEIEALGGKIYRIVPKSVSFAESLSQLTQIVRENGYENVLCSSVKPGTVLELMAARRGGAKRLIYRSSNASVDGGVKQRLLHGTVGRLAHIVPDIKIAPSIEAAEYCFGKGCVQSGKAKILYNGIDTEYYRFSQIERDSTRSELGVTEDFVIAHVGRFSKAKNHSFLLEVFERILCLNPTARLLLIGEGELKEQITAQAERLGISDRIIFMGIRNDIPRLLAAADLFVFPSFYEGMPNTVIEAQALSLHCLVSENVTKQANITGLVEFLPLGDAKEWAQAAVKYADGYERHDMSEVFSQQGYDVKATAREFVHYCFGDE